MIYCMLHLTTSTFAKSVEDLMEDRVLGQAAGDLQVDRLRSACPTCAINVTAQAQYMYELQTKYISNETNEIQLNTRPSTDQHVQPSNMDLSPAGVNKKPKNTIGDGGSTAL